jgi:hypothetical protein
VPVLDNAKEHKTIKGSVDVQTLEKVKQQWQSAADMMPQLICVDKGHLIHTNRRST